MHLKTPTDKVTTTIKRFIEMEAQDCSTEEKMKELFGITSKDDPGYHAAECKMSRWRKHPLYDQIWRETIAKMDYVDYSMSRRTLRKAMKGYDELPWMATQAAVNVMASVGKRIFGAEESTVHVHVSGMPEIGSPDQPEEDG